MMNRNWFLFAFALVALASCSVEKRVYQPGYHIEWNHYAKQDVEQDVEQDATQDFAQDATQDATQDVAQDVAQDATQDQFQDPAEELSDNLSDNLETGDSKREKMVQLIQSVVPVQINSAIAESQLGQRIDSDLALILFILLALILPALTVFLLEGFSKNFWIALLLMICGLSLTSSVFLVGAILEVIAIVLAIGVVLGKS